MATHFGPVRAVTMCHGRALWPMKGSAGRSVTGVMTVNASVDDIRKCASKLRDQLESTPPRRERP